MRQPMMSGWCAHPSGGDNPDSHGRCSGGNTANPNREFQPCPCPCHLGEQFECGNCGKALAEAPHWPNEDEPGEMVYTHIDPVTGQATGEECDPRFVTEPDEDVYGDAEFEDDEDDEDDEDEEFEEEPA